MGLSNGAKRARMYSSTINQNQGGGSKKAGFPYIVGRDSWVSVYLGSNNVQKCMSLPCLKVTRNPWVRQNRPMGSPLNVPYWSNGSHA